MTIVFIIKTKNESIYILFFVDDLLICSKNKQLIKKLKNKLSNKFKIKTWAKLKVILE